jgi:RNA polymerase sigma-70 factor (ECF subfamily)
MTEEAAVADPWSAQERRRVSRLCVVLTGDPAAADDLAQETLLQAWRIRDRLVDPAARGPWLDAIARHVCRRCRTRQGRIGVHELPGEPAGTAHADQDELLDHLEHEELAVLLERALSRLPSETRQALVARYVDDLAPAEIAAGLGLSPQAVSMRLVRGRSRIRQLLETELVDDPLAQAWVGRHGVAWRATRVPCASCGRPGTSMRRDTRVGAVELRCDSCEPDGVASRWRLDNPALAPHLEGSVGRVPSSPGWRTGRTPGGCLRSRPAGWRARGAAATARSSPTSARIASRPGSGAAGLSHAAPAARS